MEYQGPLKGSGFLVALGQTFYSYRRCASPSEYTTDARCRLCRAADSWRHALLECNLAKCVWALENESIVVFLSQNHCTDASAWLVEIMSSLRHTDITRVVVRLWAIWYVRRLAIHENQFQNPLSTLFC